MKKTGLELGFDYHSNKTALMNTELFSLGCADSTRILEKHLNETILFSSTTAKLMGKFMSYLS